MATSTGRQACRSSRHRRRPTADPNLHRLMPPRAKPSSALVLSAPPPQPPPSSPPPSSDSKNKSTNLCFSSSEFRRPSAPTLQSAPCSSRRNSLNSWGFFRRLRSGRIRVEHLPPPAVAQCATSCLIFWKNLIFFLPLLVFAQKKKKTPRIVDGELGVERRKRKHLSILAFDCNHPLQLLGK